VCANSVILPHKFSENQVTAVDLFSYYFTVTQTKTNIVALL